MTQATATQASSGGPPVNTQLVDSLAQIILALTDEERRALTEKLRAKPLSEEEQAKLTELRQALMLGVEQLRAGQFTAYTNETLPDLAAKIRERGRARQEQA